MQRSVVVLVLVLLAGLASADLPHVRPAPSARKFNSTRVNNLVSSLSAKMRDKDLATLFSNCLPNTLDTTVQSFTALSKALHRPDAFVITGDITAQWLRDSTNQLLPYASLLLSSSKMRKNGQDDDELETLFCGLVQRQASDVLHDAFANAFNFAREGGPHQGDHRTPPMSEHVFEGKFETDSLAAFLKLSYALFNWTDGATDCMALNANWTAAVNRTLDVVELMQRGTEEDVEDPVYSFQRLTYVATDTLMLSGKGAPAKRCGLTKCGFRPSDDSTTLPFLVPANAMMVVELRHAALILDKMGQTSMAARASSQANEIDAAIQKHAVVFHPAANATIYAYEVDGFGAHYFMDDANVPSLLSLPYLGYVSKDDPVYQATRKFLLSDSNPYYFEGSAGRGIGGPHEGLGYIWPMSIIVQALTSDSDSEITTCLDTLKASSAGTGFLHESFWKNDVTRFTRPWFAWVNGLFGELILTLARERPHLLF